MNVFTCHSFFKHYDNINNDNNNINSNNNIGL